MRPARPPKPLAGWIFPNRTRLGSRCRERVIVYARPVNRKLVVFLPPEALDDVRDAVFAAGAGRIGAYERCSWYAAGTGTFLAGDGAEPAIGEVGREERVAELRVETVLPAERVHEVVAALVEAHPYEEVAYDLYPLAELGS